MNNLKRTAEAKMPAATTQGSDHFDVIIIGAGFAGMYILHKLRGLGFAVRVLDVASDVGGTWYWNRYPGARCDVESMQYSYQFSDELQQEWEWTERYAAQPEILDYANHVANRFDLRRDIQFNTRVGQAIFDERTNRWQLRTDTKQVFTAQFCVMATGCLSATNIPKFEGLDSFAGPIYHTGRWPHEPVSFNGQRVGVIGTGSSAIQSIPVIAEQAEHLYVFQRTPHYTVPANNMPLDPKVQKHFKDNYPEIRAKAKQMPTGLMFRFNKKSALEATPEEREQEYESRWQEGGVPFIGAFSDLNFSREANETAAAFVRKKIHQIVNDPVVAEALTPQYAIGCKRLAIDIGYYETYNRSNVTLVDIRDARIDKITPKGIMAKGEETELDAIVLATGFDAMTGALLNIDIQGRESNSLKDKWQDGPITYLGLMMAGFPNLFTITGPGSPSVLTNMLPSIEQHVEWVTDCLAYLKERGIGRIEPTSDAEDEWMEHNKDVSGSHIRSSCNSWYVGANVPGKPRVFMPYVGGFPAYVKKCEEVVAADYAGFALS